LADLVVPDLPGGHQAVDCLGRLAGLLLDGQPLDELHLVVELLLDRPDQKGTVIRPADDPRPLLVLAVRVNDLERGFEGSEFCEVLADLVRIDRDAGDDLRLRPRALLHRAGVRVWAEPGIYRGHGPAVLREQFFHLGHVAPLFGEAQGCLAPGSRRVHIRAGLEQRLGNVDMPHHHGHMQAGEPGTVLRCQIRLDGQQRIDDLPLAPLAGQDQDRCAVRILDVGVCPRVQEEVCRLNLARVHRPLEGRIAEGVHRVEIGLLVDVLLDLVDRSVLGRHVKRQVLTVDHSHRCHRADQCARRKCRQPCHRMSFSTLLLESENSRSYTLRPPIIIQQTRIRKQKKGPSKSPVWLFGGNLGVMEYRIDEPVVCPVRQPHAQTQPFLAGSLLLLPA